MYQAKENKVYEGDVFIASCPGEATAEAVARDLNELTDRRAIDEAAQKQRTVNETGDHRNDEAMPQARDWREENRRAKIHMSLNELATLVDLPEGLTIERAWLEYDPMRVLFVVGGDSLATHDPAAELPILDGQWGAESIVGTSKGGHTRLFRRWNWVRS